MVVSSPFETGDTVRIDIPDETDPDFDVYHCKTGTIVDVLQDDASNVTGDSRDDVLYRVELFDTGEQADFRWRDLRPV